MEKCIVNLDGVQVSQDQNKGAASIDQVTYLQGLVRTTMQQLEKKDEMMEKKDEMMEKMMEKKDKMIESMHMVRMKILVKRNEFT